MTGSRGLLVVVSGPSGVGKDSVIHELRRRDPGLKYSVSYTTRRPRPGEVDGADYSFVSDEEFDRLIADGALLEWANVHGHRSGTGLQRVEEEMAAGHDLVLNIDVQGGAAIRRKLPEAFLVFLAPPDLEELSRRRVGRGTEDPEELARRAADAREEMGYADRYDVVVVNDDLDRAVQEVQELIERRRTGDRR